MNREAGHEAVAVCGSSCSTDQSVQVSSGVLVLPERTASDTLVPSGVSAFQRIAPQRLIMLASKTCESNVPLLAYVLFNVYSLPGSPVPITIDPSGRRNMHVMTP